jgi:hypothetical protein
MTLYLFDHSNVSHRMCVRRRMIVVPISDELGQWPASTTTLPVLSQMGPHKHRLDIPLDIAVVTRLRTVVGTYREYDDNAIAKSDTPRLKVD